MLKLHDINFYPVESSSGNNERKLHYYYRVTLASFNLDHIWSFEISGVFEPATKTKHTLTLSSRPSGFLLSDQLV